MQLTPPIGHSLRAGERDGKCECDFEDPFLGQPISAQRKQKARRKPKERSSTGSNSGGVLGPATGLNSRATSTRSPGRASLFSLPMAKSQLPIVVFPAWPHVSLCRRAVQDMIGTQK
jgi:hypothetical protein